MHTYPPSSENLHTRKEKLVTNWYLVRAELEIDYICAYSSSRQKPQIAYISAIYFRSENVRKFVGCVYTAVYSAAYCTGRFSRVRETFLLFPSLLMDGTWRAGTSWALRAVLSFSTGNVSTQRNKWGIKEKKKKKKTISFFLFRIYVFRRFLRRSFCADYQQKLQFNSGRSLNQIFFFSFSLCTS